MKLQCGMNIGIDKYISENSKVRKQIQVYERTSFMIKVACEFTGKNELFNKQHWKNQCGRKKS